MADPTKPSEPENRVVFASDGDILEILEENTTPGTPSESHRRFLERKYGKKNPPNESAEGPKEQ